MATNDGYAKVTPKRKPGRPPGSKNKKAKPKAKVATPKKSNYLYIVKKPGLLAGEDRAFGDKLTEKDLAGVSSAVLKALLDTGVIAHKDERLDIDKKTSNAIKSLEERISALEAKVNRQSVLS